MKKIVLTVVAGAMMVVVMSCENKEKKAYQASVDSLQMGYDSIGKLAADWHQQYTVLFESCNADTTVADSVKAEVFGKINADWTAFESEWMTKDAAVDSLKADTSGEIKTEEVNQLESYLDGADEKLAYFQSQLEAAKTACKPQPVVSAVAPAEAVDPAE